ncbi:unnamed protein product [Kuraishia capsulata CBS 1993]|uniref:DASH complex subunit SPC19 n=1 Tax=Kuraishia capsulata CBS 1993 TaxID=1382522 RepID=W6MFZ3_9ASCO|nr:uncharacterized protein KUCA_T00000557001 [Kuraishia capsulata CBS 1993]CDK24591.1 unnamed protein product [Kuraishia capsulata CBS 1993]
MENSWYAESITRFQSSIYLLDDCNDMLSNATKDHDRLKTILSVQKHFELKADKNPAMDENILSRFVEPDVEAKLSKIEALLADLEQSRDRLKEEVNTKREKYRQVVIQNLANSTELEGSGEEKDRLRVLLQKYEENV